MLITVTFTTCSNAEETTEKQPRLKLRLQLWKKQEKIINLMILKLYNPAK